MTSRLRLVVFALLSSALPAWSQDGGAAFGLSAGAPIGPFDRLLERPLWVDSARRVYTELPNQQGVRCSAANPDGGAPQVIDTPGPLGDVRLFTREGSDTVFFMSLAPGGGAASFSSVVCGTPAQALGTLTIPAGPPFFSPAGGVHAVDTDGSLLYPSSSGVVRITFAPAPTASFAVTKAELVALLGVDGDPPDASLDVDRLQVAAVRRTAAGALVMVVERRNSSGANLFTWVVEQSAAGVLSVRWGPDTRLFGMLDTLLDWPGLGASLFTGYQHELSQPWKHPVLALVPHARALRGPVPPWPHQPTLGSPLPADAAWRAFVGSSSGAPHVVADRFGQLFLFPLSHAPASADFDRDGLVASVEQGLGTSDFETDSDGDGTPDGLERLVFSTDPASVASQPDAGRSSDDVVLAPSVLAHHWPELPPPDCIRPTPYSWGREVCFSARVPSACAMPPSTFTCLDDQLRELPGSPFTSSLAPRFTARGDAQFRFDGAGWSAFSPSGGAGQPFPVPWGGGDSFGVIPLSATRALFFDPTRHALWRSDGVSAFAVIDPDRAACPVLGNAAALARCSEFPSAPVTNVRLQGFDAPRAVVLVTVTTTQGRALWGVGEDEVRFLGDVLGVTSGLDLDGVVRLPGGGYVLHHDLSQVLGERRLGARLEPLATFQPPMVTPFPLPPFGPGFRDSQYEGLFVEPVSTGPGGCVQGGWGDTKVFVCDRIQSNPPPMLVTVGWTTRWLPVSPAVEKGEVIIWSWGRLRNVSFGGSIGFLGRDGGVELPEQYQAPGWLLWRYTPLGAVSEWLTASDFIAHLSMQDRSALAATPLGDVLDMGASPDGTKLCLAEPGAGRVWEIVLDAATRTIATVRLAVSSAATACAYADDGTLAWAEGSPSWLRHGARNVALGVRNVTALVRSPGRFVAQGEGEPVRCVLDDDTVLQSTTVSTAMTEALGGLAWIADVADAGQGVVGTAERLCAGGGGTESLLHPDMPFWTGLYNPLVTPRTANAAHGSIAVRPDGLLLAGARDIEFTGYGKSSRTDENAIVKNYFFHVFPRYQPLGAERSPQLDAFRLRRETVYFGAKNVLNVGAMVLVPGAEASRDWGYRTRPGDAGFTPFDAGVPTPPDAGAPTTPMEPRSCGCGASGAVSVLALLLLLVRRRASQ